MHTPRKLSPRDEYRRRRNERVNNSKTLEQTFPSLKKLAVDLEHLDAAGIIRTGLMTCKLNVVHAKSMLCFNCADPECVGGDFDITQKLVEAISAKRTSFEGEMRCQGIRHRKLQNERIPCQRILRYKLTLRY